MKAFHCVDYLSHRWAKDDLVCSYHQIRKKLTDLSHQNFLDDTFCDNYHPSLRNQRSQILAEEYKLKRLENALWRSMARVCAPNLGRDNVPVDPQSINWQKANDITWLYGPFYQLELKHPSSLSLTLSPSPSLVSSPTVELKPVLKKREPVHDVNDLLDSAWGIDPAIISNASRNPEPITYHGRRRTTWPRLSFDKKTIRFDPNITLLEYTPSSPVIRLVIPHDESRESRSQQKRRLNHSSRTLKSSPTYLDDDDWLPPSPPPSPPLDFCNDELYFELESITPNSDNPAEGQSMLTLTQQVATNVKDIAVLCGTLVVYKGISMTVQPIAWMAERFVGRE